DLEMEKRVQALALELARAGLVSSMHDVSDGGIAVALVECCVAVDDPAQMVGARLSLPEGSGELAALLFSEEPSRIIASTAPAHVAELKRRAAAAGVPVTDLGATARADFVLTARQTEMRATLTELRDARERCLVSIVGD